MALFSKTREKKIKAAVILEVIGTPKEHVEQTMDALMLQVKENSNLEILSFKKHKAKERKNYFTTFTEFEILFKDLPMLLNFCFDYMPSSVDILEPVEFELEAPYLNDFINDFLARLHNSDMLVKNIKAENIILQKNSSNLLKNLLSLSLKNESKDLALISKDTGIPEDQLKGFLGIYLEEGWLLLNENLYSLKKQ
jgi:hypothetical protein